MNRNNGFLNFVCACIPGVGLMYNGLIKKGLSILFLFMAVDFLGDTLWLSSISTVILVPLWFYSFFKTYEVNKRLRNGEYIQDEFLFGGDVTGELSGKLNGKYEVIFGVLFIAVGALAILNRYFGPMVYNLRRIGGPVIFIVIGLFILYKSFMKDEK